MSPARNPRPCSSWPCPHFKPCPVHGRYRHDRDAERERNARRSVASKIYNSGRWKRLRRRTLLERPWCVWPGCHLPAVEVDHRISVDEAPELAFDEDNLQPYCVPHHHRKTADDVARRRAGKENP